MSIHLRSSQAAARLSMTSASFYKALQRGTLEKAGVNCTLWSGGQRRFVADEIDRLIDPATGFLQVRLGSCSSAK